ncbi:hypothetical protein HK099_007148 [Clydaea vesicula]|uniref:CHY-type domain-containing protein n=1 Tax=Clydaea vesicula TaxID=447962 RepID=A0AAD5Y2U3_9FUNG|nr:hypothetical protein HK099_007148 [Clydaea vesicula]KAJ3394244.1 hypothetical protein HDU92_007103 [Lobulomyces angularis]
MCKHIVNAQVSVRAPCKKWFDCPECHEELAKDHPLQKTHEMVFACKKCKKVFRKDMAVYEDSDEYCPNCDNHYVIEAKERKPELQIGVEGDDPRIMRDYRAKQKYLNPDEVMADIMG